MRVGTWVAALSLIVSSGALVFACSDSGGLDPGLPAGDVDAGVDGSGGGDDTSSTFDIGGECVTSSDCGGGVCVDGKCCSSADAICGSTCCAAGTVCLFEKCVPPGGPCFTGNDCAPDEYCETALGGGAPGGDAGTSEAGADGGSDAGPACPEPPPIPGRCVKRPAICPDPPDGGVADAGAGDCIPKCEYRPEAGKLNAIQEWTWGPKAKEYPNQIDVWSTPTVGRVYDTNCDGKVDQLDPPNVIFVAANASGTCCQCDGKTPTSCHTGVLRMLNGRTGEEIWSLRKASDSSVGFSGTSVALGDLTGDGRMDIAAVTGEGFVVVVDATGKVVMTSDKPIPGAAASVAGFGWGGGLAIADMDHDGAPEIAYGHTVFTTKGGALTLLFGTSPNNQNTDLSFFVDLDGAPDGNLELLTGPKAIRADGTTLWNRSSAIADGFPAVGDFDKDGKPEVVLVNAGNLYILEGATGKTLLGPTKIPGTGSGGPPTVADFDGDKMPEIGVAMQNQYSVLEPDLAKGTVSVLWSAANHDLSSSQTGSSVFDFEGDGRAEVIYNDECFLWVYDGPTGAVRFVGLTTSFTATEASVVADVDGDGRAEILMGSNRADPSGAGWKCNVAPWNAPDPATGRPAWKPPPGGTAYSGITVFGDAANGWVGTRTLWNQHAYHVTNVCDDRDSACTGPNVYGSIPKDQQKNWSLPWLNNFRQNVQDKGIFDAPDATVSLAVKCSTPVVLQASLRNAGLASLPAGVEVGFYDVTKGGALLGKVKSTKLLFPGQTEVLTFTVPAADGSRDDTYQAKIEIDPASPTFRQCRDDNDSSAESKAACPK